ncbi:hypothetical protein TRIP_B200251 [uncultured Desulfatiglans sp.]|nr:hypothetical protein TRIP_B200251 [uncultured Desulfatiglans sp.]
MIFSSAQDLRELALKRIIKRKSVDFVFTGKKLGP